KTHQIKSIQKTATYLVKDKQTKQTMKYLVTGGAGFIGSNIVKALLERDDSVIIIDDFSQISKEICRSRLGKLIEEYKTSEKGESKLKIITGSVTDTKLLDKICSENKIDGIFHLAAIASVQKSIDDPIKSNQVNAVGTLNILTAAKNHKIRKVVFSASAAAYGDNPIFPKKETMQTEPLSPYAVQKITSEMYCRIFSELYGVKTVSLRYFNVFGPGQDPNGEYAAVIAKFTEKITKHQSPTIYGSGEQTRDFVYVKDVVDANLLSMDSEITGLFNIGTGIQTSLNDLAEMIMKAAGIKADIIYEKARDGDILYSVADISKAKKILGYSPKYTIEDGIKETVKYFSSLAE
ncbi:MAG TPA: SDR family oxidoreductase, partial [Methanocorpusculum sp.]|nr:SDR family oxidoreductase [Methanocorpusculum sp.]